MLTTLASPMQKFTRQKFLELCAANHYSERGLLTEQPWSLEIDGQPWTITVDGRYIVAFHESFDYPPIPEKSEECRRFLTTGANPRRTRIGDLQRWCGEPWPLVACESCEGVGRGVKLPGSQGELGDRRLEQLAIQRCPHCYGVGYEFGDGFCRKGVVGGVLINRELLGHCLRIADGGEEAKVDAWESDAMVKIVTADFRACLMGMDFDGGWAMVLKEWI